MSSFYNIKFVGGKKDGKVAKVDLGSIPFKIGMLLYMGAEDGDEEQVYRVDDGAVARAFERDQKGHEALAAVAKIVDQPDEPCSCPVEEGHDIASSLASFRGWLEVEMAEADGNAAESEGYYHQHNKIRAGVLRQVQGKINALFPAPVRQRIVE